MNRGGVNGEAHQSMNRARARRRYMPGLRDAPSASDWKILRSFSIRSSLASRTAKIGKVERPQQLG
jgi:hypothetical protein